MTPIKIVFLIFQNELYSRFWLFSTSGSEPGEEEQEFLELQVGFMKNFYYSIHIFLHSSRPPLTSCLSQKSSLSTIPEWFALVGIIDFIHKSLFILALHTCILRLKLFLSPRSLSSWFCYLRFKFRRSWRTPRRWPGWRDGSTESSGLFKRKW